MEDFDEFLPAEEEEEIAAEEEGVNRTFIFLVSAFVGLLALGICAFIVVMVWFRPQQASENESILATNTFVAAAATETAVASPTATETPTPTETPTSTSTPTPTPTSTPTEPAEPTESEGSPTLTEATDETQTSTEPTATRKPTDTPTRETGETPADTGIGALGAGVVALGLFFLLMMVRRLRNTA